MWKVTLRGLLAHRVRLALTTLSVVLGVAFVAGTYVMTDTMTRVFDDMVRGGSATIDVLVRADASTEAQLGTDSSYYGGAPFDASILEVVREVDGVRVAEGTVEGYAMIVRPDGEPIVPMGPPTLGSSWVESGERDVREGGRHPTTDGEVAIDARTADRNDLEVGDRVTMVFGGSEPRPFEVVGISTAEFDNLAGATLAEFELSVAQEVLDRPDAFTGINVLAEEGTTSDELAARLNAALPGEVQAITSADWADETMLQIEDAVGFFTIVLGVFAGIALVVGAFIIANTFSITVVQRSREFALVRALGASRRQVIGSVVGEAVVIGVLASVLGVLAGVGLAVGLQALLSVFGLDMPSGTLVVEPRTVVVALIVGLSVTVLASLLPARRAAAVHPLAALRDAEVTTDHPSRRQIVVGSLVGALALTFALIGAIATPDGAGTLVAAGALLTLIALVIAGPALTGPVLRVFGGSGGHLGVVGRLARGNSLRTPKRTWSTAAALTVGLALVSGVAVLTASTKASLTDALDSTLRADLIVTPANAMMGGSMPPVLAERLRALDTVDAVSPLRLGSGTIDGEPAFVTSLDPASWDRLHDTRFVEGTIDALTQPSTVAIDEDQAADAGYHLGDTVPAGFTGSGPTQLTIAGIYEADEVVAGWITSTGTSDTLFAQPLDAAVLLAGTTDTQTETLRAAVETVTSGFPAVTVQDQAQYRDSIAGQLDQLLAMVTALLAMALFIAVLGIMNTLALSVHERTREIGLLRAVGMTRAQARRMIRWEAVTVALLGAAVGLVLGTLLGWAATRAMSAEGLTAFQIPFGQLVGATVLAGIAGVLAAIWPARTAANLDVLRAVTVE